MGTRWNCWGRPTRADLAGGGAQSSPLRRLSSVVWTIAGVQVTSREPFWVMTQAKSVAMDTVADLLPEARTIVIVLAPGLPTLFVGCLQALQVPGG